MLTHGLAPRGGRHYLFQTWIDIRKRCRVSTSQHFDRYGARGITVHEPWVNDARAFADWVLANLGERPAGMSLDRIDNDGNYEPGNLRWATKQEQVDNRSIKPRTSTREFGIQQIGARFRVRVRINRQTITVGTFDTLAQAVAARNAAH